MRNEHTPEARALYKRAIAAWGPHAQVEMLIEEMAEFIVALQHHKRSRGIDPIVLAGEIADVRITMAELEVVIEKHMPIVGVFVEGQIIKKLDRLKERLDEEEVKET